MTINKLKQNLPNPQAAPVPVPIKLEIPYAAEPPPLKANKTNSESVPVTPVLSTNPPIDVASPLIVKREPTPDPKFHQSHLQTDDEDSTSEEVPKAAIKSTPKRGRPPGQKRSKDKTKDIQAEPQEKVRKLNERFDQPEPAESPDLTITKSAKKKTYPPKKPSVGPLKTKQSKRSAGAKRHDSVGSVKSASSATEVSANIPQEASSSSPKKATETASKEATATVSQEATANALQEPPENEQSNTEEDNKVNELKNLLTTITKSEAKDPKLLDSVKNLFGQDGFEKLKSLFVENASSVECKPEEKPQVGEVPTIEPSTGVKKPKRSDSPLRMPPVSGNHPKGKKKSEVDRLNQDINDCFIRDGILSAHGLRNVSKVKYEEVVVMEDYDLDAGSCSDTDTDEPLVNIQRKENPAAILTTPPTSIESTAEPPPATKSLFIFDQKVELFSDSMEYRLLSGITGRFEVCDELKESFLEFINRRQAGSSSANVETTDCDQKPPVFPNMNDFVFDPMEVITIEDDEIAVPAVEAAEVILMEPNFEIITVDDDDDEINESIGCPILENAMKQHNGGFSATSSQSGATSSTSHQNGSSSAVNGQNGSTAQQPEQEDMIYNQVKELAPHIATNAPSKTVHSPEETVFNLSFCESFQGVLMRCRAEKCFYESRDKGLFHYHVQTRHCLVKWDGSCKLCKGSVYNFGTLLDEYNHMERYHISMLKPPAPKIFLIPENYSQQTTSAASRPTVIEKLPQPSPNQQAQQPTLRIANRPFVGKVITASELLRSLISQPAIDPPLPPNNLSLRLRQMPGDKLSGGSPSGVLRRDGSTESPVKNTVQVSSTFQPMAPKPIESTLSTSAPSVPAPPQGLIGVRPPANSNYIGVVQPALRSLPLPPLAPSVMPSRFTSPSVSNPALNQPAPPALVSIVSEPPRPTTLIPTTAASATNAMPPTRLLRPWLDDDDKKSLGCIKKMTEVDCLRNLYKCMATACYYSTNNAVQFGKHLAVHAKINVQCPQREYARCAYCLFKADTITALVNHFTVEHKFDIYGCTQCFYRAIAPDTVRDHEKMFHLYTGIQIMSNHATNALIPYREAVQAAKEGRRNFVPMISCAGEFGGRFRRTKTKILKNLLLLACLLKFHHFELYREHLRSDHNSINTQFRCNKCKELTNCDDIQVHLENCHRIMKFHCLQCPLGFTNMNDLLKHLINCHPNKLPFFCERSIDKCNYDVPQSSPESVVIQFWGDIMRHVKMISANAVQSVAPQ